jgi:hypothetical protein
MIEVCLQAQQAVDCGLFCMLLSGLVAKQESKRLFSFQHLRTVTAGAPAYQGALVACISLVHVVLGFSNRACAHGPLSVSTAGSASRCRHITPRERHCVGITVGFAHHCSCHGAWSSFGQRGCCTASVGGDCNSRQQSRQIWLWQLLVVFPTPALDMGRKRVCGVYAVFTGVMQDGVRGLAAPSPTSEQCTSTFCNKLHMHQYKLLITGPALH